MTRAELLHRAGRAGRSPSAGPEWAPAQPLHHRGNRLPPAATTEGRRKVAGLWSQSSHMRTPLPSHSFFRPLDSALSPSAALAPS